MKSLKCLTAIAAIALTSSACAGALPQMPDVGIQPTGEPLSVQKETRSYTYTTEEKAGEVVHRDSSGREIGSSEVYVEKENTGYYDVWFTMQGQTRVDEADFYRMAGEDAIADDILRQRKRAHTTNRVGMFGGAGAMAAGLGLMYARLFSYDPTTPGGSGQALTYASTGLLITGAIGITVGYLAGRKLNPEFRFTEYQDAANAASEFNASNDAAPQPVSYLRSR
jgi:hypothetical protein